MNLFCLNKFYDNEEIVVVVLGVFNVNVITHYVFLISLPTYVHTHTHTYKHK